MNPADKKEEVLSEFPFLSGNDKWGGKVQVLRVTVPQNDGPPRVFINKRLIFTGSHRYINLPRNGIDDVVTAILDATDSEREHYGELIKQINAQRNDSTQPQNRRNDRRRNRDDEGDCR